MQDINIETQSSISDEIDEESIPALDIFIGSLLILIALPIIWMNESRQIRILNMVQEAIKQCKNDFKIDEIRQ